MSTLPIIHWSNGPPPGRIVTLGDRSTADEAYGLACQGIGLLWEGDFHNGRQMLTALAHRADRQSGGGRQSQATFSADPAAQFHRYRQHRSQRARVLAMVLLAIDAQYQLALRRAPEVRQACLEAFGEAEGAGLLSLQALLGVIGAHEWRRRGIEVPALGDRIHPHYGVFAPIRSEYLELVESTPLPSALGRHDVAFDIGTGTGVLAAVLARRGVGQVVATDLAPRALLCARDNVARLGLTGRIDVVAADLFPPGRAALVVCNPPWLPARPTSELEQALYDPDSRMLQGYLHALPAHLDHDGEGWLILSDIAERLGLRSREDLLRAIAEAGLIVHDRHDVRPRHPRVADAGDALHHARAAEVTSLWRLSVA